MYLFPFSITCLSLFISALATKPNSFSLLMDWKKFENKESRFLESKFLFHMQKRRTLSFSSSHLTYLRRMMISAYDVHTGDKTDAEWVVAKTNKI